MKIKEIEKHTLNFAIFLTFCSICLFASLSLFVLAKVGFCISIVAFIFEMIIWKVKFGVTRSFKWMITLLLSMLFLVGWFVGVLLTAFNGDSGFYFPFLTVCVLLLIGWLIGWCYTSPMPRWMKLTLPVLLVIAPLFPVGYEYQKSQQNKIPRLSEEFSLRGYAPFTDSPILARLEEDAILQMNEPLPVIDGATALYPLYAAFAETTYPYNPDKYDYDELIRGSSTPQAYQSLITGVADVIFCAQPSQKQWEDVKNIGDTFLMTPIGKEAFVFFVNKENPVCSLTSQHIRDIYSGKITNWRQVGGSKKSILAFQRPPGSGSQTMLQHIMGDIPLMNAPQNQWVMNMGEIIDWTADYQNSQNALGYSFLFFTQSMVANGMIRLLDIDGVTPSRENIRNDSYPFIGDFYAITLSQPSENTQRLIEWILSPQGQQLVENTGYVPINF